MNNTKQIIENHNKRVLNSPQHIDGIANSSNVKDNKIATADQIALAHLMNISNFPSHRYT